MTIYHDCERGQFQTEYGKQLVSYEGMLFKGRTGHLNVTPTDVDGLIQLDNENCIVFFELKHSGSMPTGQSDALKKLADAIQAGGVNCAVFTAVHNTPHPQMIAAKDAIVTEIYWDGKTRPPRKEGVNLYEYILNYIDYIKEE